MARGKTKLARIEDDKVLKSTFKKRKNGLMKKIQELTILCDIIACVIIYSPVIGNRSPEIFTWPEDQEKVRAAIRMYKEKEDHLKRTVNLCNYLKNRRRLDMSDNHQKVNNMSMSPEVALAYLNWVDARIKAVDERIELVKNFGNMMLFGNDHCHNVMSDDKLMMMMPVNQLTLTQDGNFEYQFLQEWNYQQNPYSDFDQFDSYVYNQTMRGGACNNSPMCMNIVPEASHEFQQPIDMSAMRGYQIPNQLCSYDPYLLGMEQTDTMGMSINGGLFHQQQEQEQKQEQEQHGEKMQCLSSVNQAQFQGQPLMCGEMDGLMQLCPYIDEWLNPDAASSSLSIQFNKAAAAAAAAADGLDDDWLLNAAEFIDNIQPFEDRAAAGGKLERQNGV